VADALGVIVDVGAGRLDNSTQQDSVMRLGGGGGFKQQLLLGLGANSISSESLDYRFPCLA
jgi:hypothetical protein